MNASGPENSQPGTIVTFYSFKGGVGRTFALTNVAAQLSAWGYRVLCIDWDIEAPGFDRFFQSAFDRCTRSGLPELIRCLIETDEEKIHGRFVEPYVRQFRPATDMLPIDVIFSGSPSAAGYGRRIAEINWRDAYNHRLGNKLEIMKQNLRTAYDFVLIDSRTGMTDTSSICTMHLPDILVMVYSANEQSIQGLSSIGRQAVLGKEAYYFTEGRLRVLPILSKFDAREHPALASEWLARIVQNESLMDFYEDWIPPKTSLRNLINATKLPYVSRWSFGEDLAVLSERGLFDGTVCSDGELISYSLQNVSALLCHNLSDSDILLANRERYISAAAKESLDTIFRDNSTASTSEWKRPGRRFDEMEMEKEKSLLRLFSQKIELLFATGRYSEAEGVLKELNLCLSELRCLPVSPLRSTPLDESNAEQVLGALKERQRDLL